MLDETMHKVHVSQAQYFFLCKSQAQYRTTFWTVRAFKFLDELCRQLHLISCRLTLVPWVLALQATVAALVTEVPKRAPHCVLALALTFESNSCRCRAFVADSDCLL